jgi:arsenite/tail-anchored protein-transporting ATPase
MRLILYLGKGGVGKTTVAAATALRCAELGYRTLVVSTDIAHSLADVLDSSLNVEPIAVAQNLWAQEINVLDEMRTHWHELWDYLASMLRRRGISQAIAEELAIVPGMAEMASLLHIYRQSQKQTFDVMVVDAAPTGETIRLLTVPETFQWYAGRLTRDEGPWKLAQSFGLAPTHETFDLLDRLEAEMKELRQMLIDPAISSYRVVFNPEKIVIKETQRAVTYLNLFGYAVDVGIINRVLPAERSSDPYWRRLQEIQQHYLELSRNTLAPLPLFEVPWYSDEVIGLSALKQMADGLWKELDPSQLFWNGPTQKIEERSGAYVLCLPLPHVDMDQVEITKRGDELFLAIGNFKREFSLPNVLAIRQATKANLTDEGILEVHFLETTR